MASDKPLNVAGLKRENRQLKKALHAVVDAIDNSPAQIDVAEVRPLLDDVVPKGEQIAPPWTREGYESKEAWLSDRGNGGGSR